MSHQFSWNKSIEIAQELWAQNVLEQERVGKGTGWHMNWIVLELEGAETDGSGTGVHKNWWAQELVGTWTSGHINYEVQELFGTRKRREQKLEGTGTDGHRNRWA